MTDARPRYQLVGLDCPDPMALAEFYSRLTGLEVEPLGDFQPDEVEWIELDNGPHPTIAFQKVAELRDANLAQRSGPPTTPP